jgi:uncharacterized protein DUF5718
MLDSFSLDLDDLKTWAGFGVAGNFAGHLEQAGEASDFANVTAETGAPKGIFPFYIPKGDTFLSVFPLSVDAIAKPLVAAPRLQIEPEVGLACTITYDDSGMVTAITPQAFGAYNDCSIRRPGASKISEKKNWGTASKGVSRQFFSLGSASLEEATAPFRVGCYLRRGDNVHEYGVDSPLLGYSYYGERLLEWMVETLNTQVGSHDTPLEAVGEYLRAAGTPANALISIGATRYTPFGEQTYLEIGDESIVVVYDSDRLDSGAVSEAVKDDSLASLPQVSVLSQRVH